MALTISLPPRLTAQTCGAAWNAVLPALKSQTDLIVDAHAVESADQAGLALLFVVEQAGRSRPAGIRLEGLRPALAELIAHFDASALTPPVAPVRLGTLATLGRALIETLDSAQSALGFIGRCLASLARGLRSPREVRWSEVLSVATEAGANAIPIVCLIGFLMGVIIAFESAMVAEQFGAVIFVVNGVGVAMLRELGPLMTAVVFAGRSGAAFAAQLGTQKVNEELAAISTFGLDPLDFLVRPRLIASMMVVPLLTVLADLIGVLGGALVMLDFDISFVQFYNQLIGAVGIADFLVGLVKAAVFGLVIAAIGCARGLDTGAGAAAVGVSTTRAVVAGIVWIVVLDGLAALLLSRWDL